MVVGQEFQGMVSTVRIGDRPTLLRPLQPASLLAPIRNCLGILVPKAVAQPLGPMSCLTDSHYGKQDVVGPG